MWPYRSWPKIDIKVSVHRMHYSSIQRVLENWTQIRYSGQKVPKS
jgi:hypothetical protein